MSLPSVTFRTEMLNIEDISKVLVRVQRSISQQLAMRAHIGWLAADSILRTIPLVVI